jgi:hypothetical protein
VSDLPQEGGRAPIYVVTCLYGLERVLEHEVKQALGVEAERQWCEVSFNYQNDPAALAVLRTAGNVFVQFARFQIPADTAALSEIRSRLLEIPLGEWEDMCGALRELPSGDISVSVTRKGEHSFTYSQVEEAALHALSAEPGRRVSLDAAPLELRIDIDGEWCRLLGRLTAQPLSVRSYRRFHMRGATEPSLAAAMAELSDPKADDVFLDPFCGVGTVAIERALLGPAGVVLAGDVRARRVEWTVANAGEAGVDLLAVCWDAGELPLGDRSVTRVVTSPPQSDPATGARWAVEDLARLLAESLRVLAYGGKLVWLMQRGSLFQDALDAIGVRWRPKHMQCSLRGHPWVINTLHKTL